MERSIMDRTIDLIVERELICFLAHTSEQELKKSITAPPRRIFEKLYESTKNKYLKFLKYIDFF